MEAAPQQSDSETARKAVVSYEKYMVHTAQELVREIANHYEDLDKLGDEPNAKYNANRSWSALSCLGRIEL